MLKNTFLAWLSWIFTIVMGVASNKIVIRNASGYMARQKVRKTNYDYLIASLYINRKVYIQGVVCMQIQFIDNPKMLWLFGSKKYGDLYMIW